MLLSVLAVVAMSVLLVVSRLQWPIGARVVVLVNVEFRVRFSQL